MLVTPYEVPSSSYSTSPPSVHVETSPPLSISLTPPPPPYLIHRRYHDATSLLLLLTTVINENELHLVKRILSATELLFFSVCASLLLWCAFILSSCIHIWMIKNSLHLSAKISSPRSSIFLVSLLIPSVWSTITMECISIFKCILKSLSEWLIQNSISHLWIFGEN